MLHCDLAGIVFKQLQQVLDAACTLARPKHPPQPTAVRINPAFPATATESTPHQILTPAVPYSPTPVAG
jgi:hypothetical protein